jgi:RimJ/RimL family protein N-acetyltransferase
MRPDEADRVARYFHEASDADLDRMGVVDRAQLPPAEEWTARLQAAMAVPDDRKTAACLTWSVDGTAVGFCSLKNLRVGDRAELHLHMWSEAHRGQGAGPILFCLSVLEAFDRFHLRTAVCEPKSTNPMPNRMLAKVGFPLVRSYVGSSSELSRVTLLNQYDVRPTVAQEYLAAQPRRGNVAEPHDGRGTP